MQLLSVPKTKKLPEKILRQVRVNGEPLQRLFTDEQFYAVPQFPTFYVSQYGRIIKWNPKYRRPTFRKGTLNMKSGYMGFCLSNKRKKRAFTTVSRIVAEVWLRKPDWEPDTYGRGNLEWWTQLNAHHLEKVRGKIENRPIYMDFAMNLRWVYKKYHKKVDKYVAYKYRTTSKSWKEVPYLDEIADYYGCSEQVILEMLYRKPTERKRVWDYYEGTNGIVFAAKRMKNGGNENGK